MVIKVLEKIIKTKALSIDAIPSFLPYFLTAMSLSGSSSWRWQVSSNWSFGLVLLDITEVVEVYSSAPTYAICSRRTKNLRVHHDLPSING